MATILSGRNGKYEITGDAISGGCGTVTRAKNVQASIEQIYAIKKFEPDIRNYNFRQTLLEKFLREADIQKKLSQSHNQIPKVFDSFSDASGEYVVQEFIEGKTLAQRARDVGIFQEQEVINILASLLPVLAHIHSHNYVHRDIHPKNIMVREGTNALVVIDFGAVKEILTKSEEVSDEPTIAIGKDGYTPPEQLNGYPVYESDLYALGMTAICLLTGKHPTTFISALSFVRVKEWREDAPSVSDHLANVIEKAIEINYRNRHKSALAMLDDLTNPEKSNFTSHSKDSSDEEATLVSKQIDARLRSLISGRFSYKYATIDKSSGKITETVDKSQQYVCEISEEIRLEMVLIRQKNLLIGKYPVTQAQWEAVAHLPEYNKRLRPSPSLYKGDNHPVENVSWIDTVEFCLRLSHHSQLNFRLPTEEEWEFACRSGSSSPYFCGHTIGKQWANFLEVNDTKGTRPVEESVYANKWGLYDMHGNVWEWCQDFWHEEHKSGRGEISSNLKRLRVRRGGSWQNMMLYCSSDSRLAGARSLRNSIIGFRVVAE